MSISHALKGRDDISQFVVHLTRDDTKDFGDRGGTARENFVKILLEKRVGAFRSHCQFNPQLKKIGEEIESKFRVACFTETPLNMLHLLVQEIPGRSIRLEPYGLVFKKRFLVEEGAQQAIYINSYGANSWLKDAAMKLFTRCTKDNELEEPEWRLLPFLNAMSEKYDFSWEREWRVLGDFQFKISDIVCVVIPSDEETKMKDFFATSGIAAICPGWSYEEIVAELASQQRATRRLGVALKKLATHKE